MNEVEFAKRFRDSNPASNLKYGALMAIYNEARYSKTADIEPHILFMKDIGIITKGEYIDLIHLIKESKA